MGNDSLADMTKRSKLYWTVLAFVTSMAEHPDPVEVTTEKRPEKKETRGLQALGDEANRGFFFFDKSEDGLAASLATSRYESYQQAKAFVRIVKNSGMAKGFQSMSSRESISISNKIIEFYDTVTKTAPGARIGRNPKDPWTAYTEANRVAFTNDVLSQHDFINQFSVIRQSRPSRATALCKEIAILNTSLPPGIFVKIAGSRFDVMKVLITGAEGSPYAG